MKVLFIPDGCGLYVCEPSSQNVCEGRTHTFELACAQDCWMTALDLLEEGPMIIPRRDGKLLKAMEVLGEATFLTFLRAARRQDPLLPYTDFAILRFAVTRGLIGLAEEQIQYGCIMPRHADECLAIAAERNNPDLVRLLLESNLCTQSGKNKAGLAAAKDGNLNAMLELLERNALSGVYTYPMESYLDYSLGTPLQECIWSLLIREAALKEHQEVAEAIAQRKPYPLTRDDLNFLNRTTAST